ncbi:MAG: hydrogenobyrinic acid a,c-diamide synthase (glutamine-hydrolyzing) [Desulfovibrionaceae bacterium]|nr:hydrogenobyrinic acid a,c-diamide synthase (glutamine-hydrolyzing) [Desulfovibrionaceae bacterium]
MDIDKTEDAINSCPRFIISSLSGGGGKTLLALGLVRALSQQGYAVKAFKKGPDYIDATWLAKASNFPATNLDLFWLEPRALQELFYQALVERQRSSNLKLWAIVEGNRGLYDGLDLKGSASSAELARILDLPVLLSLNCTKMTRTAAAILQGLLSFEADLKFVGVILNQLGTLRQASLVRKVVEYYTPLKVIGTFPRLKENPLPERHMGLASYGSNLALDLKARLDKLAQIMREEVDLGLLAANLKGQKRLSLASSKKEGSLEVVSKTKIGVIQDQAFWFYYPENLQALKEAGAELVPLSLLDLKDEPWDLSHIQGLYVGGGFPEDYAFKLSRNPKLKQIRELANQGLPLYAECGGFMLLAKSLKVAGKEYEMAQVFEVRVEFLKKPQGLGYIEAEVIAKNPYFKTAYKFKGHEFHYSRCSWDFVPDFCLKLKRGQGMGQFNDQAYDGLLFKNTFAAYTHIFAPAVPNWAQNFVNLAKRHQA